MKIGIIGANGLIGKKRLLAIENLISQGYIIDSIYLYDVVEIENKNYNSVSSIDELISKNPDWVIVATPHDVSYDIVSRLIPSGCRILIEKPLALTFEKGFSIYKNIKFQSQVYVGHNYRFMGGIKALYADLLNDRFGYIYSVNMELGHGGSPKDEGTWKNNPIRVGIGSIFDPGIHLIDLLELINDFNPIFATSLKDENGFHFEDFVTLKSSCGKINATIHTSLVKWKNIFRIEINGSKAQGVVTGRCGNYGDQIYTINEKWNWNNAKTLIFKDCENSFTEELKSLFFGIENETGIEPCDVYSALRGLAIIEKIVNIGEKYDYR